MATSNNIDFNINLKTTSDLSGVNTVKKALNELKTITPSDFMKIHPTVDMNQARSEVMKFKPVLSDVQEAFDKALDPTTGILNIEKLNTSLNSIGIDKIATSFSAMGADGQKALTRIAAASMTTNVKLKETSSLIDNMGKSLLNTIRWSLSSGFVNNISGTFQKTAGYVRDLDESLNNIRIVTSKNADEMDRFAKEANDAAQALGTTTTSYTDASLIYYQQGLSDEEVTARTDVTTKMSNVLKESADEVSSYMTAIWNNFYDGSKSLEYYGDVITALGAATASSAAEISEGLEKFAAIGNTVGLSYEYATTALATVVAETRQSADVVGTAFKTLFARIQDLELGETLDDGTTLGKYSKALEAVGINIKDQNGQLKEMDTILDEMGSKWNTLSKDTQVALAQTVAGTRQYAQLIALMDNWDKFGENLKVTGNAIGTLNEQQAIYMDSVEAHMKTMKASAEGLYNSLLDEDTIKNFADMMSGLLTGLNKFVDALGGGQGVLLAFGGIATRVFGKQIADQITPLIVNFKNAKYNAEQLNKEMENAKKWGTNLGAILNIKGTAVDELVKLKQEIAQYYDVMSGEQRKIANNITEEIAKIKEEEEEWKNNTAAVQEYIQTAANAQTNTEYAKANSESDDDVNISRSNAKNADLFKGVNESEVKSIGVTFEAISKKIKDAEDQTENLSDAFRRFGKTASKTAFNDAISSSDKLKKHLTDLLKQGIIKSEEEYDKLIKNIDDFQKGLKQGVKPTEDQKKAFKGILDTLNELYPTLEKTHQEMIDNFIKAGSDGIEGFETKIQSLRDALGLTDLEIKKNVQSINNFASGITNCLSAVNSFKSIWNTLNDDSIDGFDKFLQITMSLTMALPQLAQGISDVTKNWGTVQKVGGKIFEGIRNAINNDVDKSALLKPALDKIKGSLTGVGGAAQDAGAALGTAAESAGSVAASTGAAGAATVSLGAVLAGVAIAAGIAYAAFKIYQAHLDKIAERSAAAAEAQQKLFNEQKEQAEQTKQLSKSIDDLNSQIVEQGGFTDDLRKEAYNLCNQYGLENEAVLALTGSYQQLKDAIQGISESETQELYESSVRTKEMTDMSLEDQIWANMKSSQKDTVGPEQKKAIDLVGFNNPNDDEKAMRNDLIAAFGDDFFLNKDHIDLEKFIDAVTENREKVEEILLKYKGTDASKAVTQLNNIINDNAEQIKNSEEAFTQANASASDLAGYSIDVESINSPEEYEQAINDYIENRNNRLIESGMLGDNPDAIEKAKEQGRKEAEAYIINLDSTLSKYAKDEKGRSRSDKFSIDEYRAMGRKKDSDTDALIDKQADADRARTEYRKSLAKDSEYQKLKKAKEDAIKARNEAQASIDNLGSAVSPEDGTEVRNIKLWQDEVKKADKALEEYLQKNNSYREEYFGKSGLAQQASDELKNDVEELARMKEMLDAELEQSDTSLNQLSSAINSAMSGQSIDDETIKYLEETYSELGLIWDKTSNAYLEKLQEIQQQEETNNQELIKYQGEISWDNAIKALENFDGATEDNADDIETLGNALDEVFSQRYELEMSITDDILTDVDNIVSMAENAADAVSKIGDGFKVAADDAEDLLMKFPELAENAEVLADGTIQLSGDVTSAVLGDIGAQVDGDTNAAIARIDNRIQELEAAKQTAQEQLDAMGDEALSETQIRDILGDDFEEMCTEESDLSAQTANNQAQNSAAGAEAIIANWAAAEQAAIDYSKTAVEAAEGKKVPTRKVKGNYLTTTTASGTTAEITSDDPDEANQALTDKIKAALQNQIDSDTKQIAQLTIAKSKLLKSKNGIKDAAEDKNDKEDKERIEEDIDAYHKWEQQIKACTNALDELEERQSHLKGKQLIKNLDAQTAALTRQMEAQKNLNGQYKAQLEYEKQRLQSYGVGASFDADGNIANYNQMMQNAQDQYNKAIEAYNKNKTDANEAAVETAKNVYDDIKKTVSNYEAALDGVQKAQQAMNKLMQKKADVSLAKLEAKWDVELQIDTHKAERDIKSFIKELNEDFTKATKSWKKQFDNAFDLFKNGKLTEDITGQISKMGDIMEWMDDVAARSNAENNFEFQEGDMFTSASDAAEYLISLEEELEELANELKQTYEDAWNAYIEGISQSIEEFERLNNIIDRNNDRLEKMQELMELSYGNMNSIDNQIANREAQLSNNQATINNTENENAMWLKQFNDIAKENGTTQLTLDASGFIDQTKVSIEEMDEAQKAMYEHMIENENTLIDSYVKRANLAKEIKDLQIDAAAKQAAQAMFGTFDIDYQRQQWEDTLKWQERYYDGQERIYQIESLGHKYDTSISNAKSLKAQEKLNKAKEYELKTLKEKQYLSKDEIALAEKRYQLTLAEIALEEAQSNKNSMKLTRNAEGNWSYQYVADDDDIAQKQQDVIDKTYDFYETAKNAYQNAVSYSYEIYDTYVERYTEIMQNTEISEQERARRLEELNDNTLKSVEALGEETTDYIIDTSTSTSLLIQDIIEEGNIAITDLTTEQQALYQAANLSNLNNLQITRAEMEKENSALALQAKTCLMDTVSTFDTEAGKVVSTWQGQSMVIKSTLENASEDGKRAVQNYQSIVNQCATRIGLDLQEPKRSFEEIKRSTDEAKQASQQYAQQTATGLSQTRGQLSQIKAAWDQVKSAIMQAVNQMQQYIGRTQQAVIACNNLVAAQTRAAAAQAAAARSSSSNNSSSGGTTGSKGRIVATNLREGGVVYHVGSTELKRDSNGKVSQSQLDEWKKQGYDIGGLVGYATGGYTGEWANGSDESNGRIAMLHQKELVLNETDTKNILDAVKSIRDLNVSSIDDAIMSGIANMIVKLSTNNIGNIPNNTSTNTSNNTFNITAEFPNANDVNEIREAIMSLPNLASQYLARR